MALTKDLFVLMFQFYQILYHHDYGTVPEIQFEPRSQSEGVFAVPVGERYQNFKANIESSERALSEQTEKNLLNSDISVETGNTEKEVEEYTTEDEQCIRSEALTMVAEANRLSLSEEDNLVDAILNEHEEVLLLARTFKGEIRP